MRSAQLLTFAASGAAVAVVYAVLVSTLLLAGVAAQAAVALAYAVAVTLHFAMNRRFVFVHRAGYARRLSGQGVRYLAVAFTSWAASAGAVATLPRQLGVPSVVVALAAAVLLSVFSFLALRNWVFPSASSEQETP